MIGEWTSARTKRKIVDALGSSVPCGPVNTAPDILDDPHVKQRDMIAWLEQPGMDRLLPVVGAPIKMTGTPTGVDQRAELLGEHSKSVLTDLGYGQEQIQQLASDGVVVLHQEEAIAPTKG